MRAASTRRRTFGNRGLRPSLKLLGLAAVAAPGGPRRPPAANFRRLPPPTNRRVIHVQVVSPRSQHASRRTFGGQSKGLRQRWRKLSFLPAGSLPKTAFDNFPQWPRSHCLPDAKAMTVPGCREETFRMSWKARGAPSDCWDQSEERHCRRSLRDARPFRNHELFVFRPRQNCAGN